MKANQSPFIVMVTFSVKPRYISRMRLIARDLTLASRVEEGCILYQFTESREMKNHLLLYMIWQDEEAFNRYGDLPLVRAFDSGVAEELLTEPYVITTWSSLG